MSAAGPDLRAFDAEIEGVVFRDADDFYRIGRLYARGQGLPVDLATGYVWLRYAAARGSRPAARLVQEISAEMERPDLDRAKIALRRLTERDTPDQGAARAA
ncbi:MAG: SEL1-like repeat protein [Microvirga sp.]|nr:SEL1-like repeat protein [Microvirga sp.]